MIKTTEAYNKEMYARHDVKDNSKRNDGWIVDYTGDSLLICKIARELPDKYGVLIYGADTEIFLSKDRVFSSKCKAIMKLWYSKYSDQSLEDFIKDRYPESLDKCREEFPQYFI
jgi:hypothetical protein